MPTPQQGDYKHFADGTLHDLHNTMQYNAQGLPVIRTISTSSTASADGQRDAFGRLRVSTAFTLFDSQLRYTQRNDLFNNKTVGSGSINYLINESSAALTVGTASGDYAGRETIKVMGYQPGKSLQILCTFVMDQGQVGVTQRVGYFGARNGVYFANIDGVNCVVLRTYTSGAVQETIVPQSDWNVDKLDGSTLSVVTLDSTKAQIFFVDLEWLGVGQVRCGFVIDGNFYIVHVFSHANDLETVYMTTATLPVRYEIENTQAVAASSTLKQICCSVVSEGGYEVRGRPRSAGTAITDTYTLTTAGQYYPVVAIRLRAGYEDSVVIPKNISLVGLGNGGHYRWVLLHYPTTVGGTWVPAGNTSSVEYNVTGTSIAAGNIANVELMSGYEFTTNQGGVPVTLGSDSLKFQLRRNGFTGERYELILAVAGRTAAQTCLGSMDWDEIV